MSDLIIAPSILSCDFGNLEYEVKRLESGGADWIHIDVMDGHFVPNITIGAPVVKSIRKICNIPLDVHLMIDNPEKYIKDFALAGSDIITFHYEAVKEKTPEVINLIKSYNIKAGISIKPNTPSSEIKSYVNMADLILIMTVEPGFGGQKFIEECIKKAVDIKSYVNKNIIIEADGGINNETAIVCRDFGINALVSGNYILSSNNIEDAIESLRV